MVKIEKEFFVIYLLALKGRGKREEKKKEKRKKKEKKMIFLPCLSHLFRALEVTCHRLL